MPLWDRQCRRAEGEHPYILAFAHCKCLSNPSSRSFHKNTSTHQPAVEMGNQMSTLFTPLEFRLLVDTFVEVRANETTFEILD